jgi:hypothetical protein
MDGDKKNAHSVLLGKSEVGQLRPHTDGVKLPPVSDSRLMLRLYSTGDR